MAVLFTLNEGHRVTSTVLVCEHIRLAMPYVSAI